MQASVCASPTCDVSHPALVNYRKHRYQGDDFCVSMGMFAESDQARLEKIYRLLERFFVVLKRRQSTETAATLTEVQAFIAAQDTDEWLSCIQPLGVESLRSQATELMAKTVHDLRGGAMSALLGQLQLAQLRAPHEHEIRQLFFLTRDHLKIMRNALLGLDDVKRQADLIPKLHGVDLIIEKWQNALLHNARRPTRLAVASHFHGNIAECCVEFGALDRVLYNLVNNACRHTASGEVQLLIQSQPDDAEQPENLCFRVSNPVDAADLERLHGLADLQELFQPGTSSTGSGFGLTVALDFVANAYGLSTRQQALEGHYLGAELVEQAFSVWFYWPVTTDV